VHQVVHEAAARAQATTVEIQAVLIPVAAVLQIVAQAAAVAVAVVHVVVHREEVQVEDGDNFRKQQIVISNLYMKLFEF